MNNFEQSPFLRYPLIKHENTYFVISEILCILLFNFRGGSLESTRPPVVHARIRTRIEVFIGESLSSVVNNVVTEEDLMDYFQTKEGAKVRRFLFADNGSNIYIEVKGVELRWDFMVSDSPETIVETK